LQRRSSAVLIQNGRSLYRSLTQKTSISFNSISSMLLNCGLGPQDLVSLHEIGELVLGRTVDEFFSEVE
jgi:catalase